MKGNALDRVRQLCAALPETNERLSHGAPTFFIRDKKTFVTFMNNPHADGRLAIWCHAPLGMQAVLVEQDPERFFVPPYVGHRGWVGLRLDRDVDWDRVADLIGDAYRMVAPKQHVAQFAPRTLRTSVPSWPCGRGSGLTCRTARRCRGSVPSVPVVTPTTTGHSRLPQRGQESQSGPWWSGYGTV